MIVLLTGQQLNDPVVRVLDEIRVGVMNARGMQKPPEDLRVWANDAERQLRLIVPRSEIDRLVVTHRAFVVMSSGSSPETHRLALAELDDAFSRWEAELAEIKAWRVSFPRFGGRVG